MTMLVMMRIEDDGNDNDYDNDDDDDENDNGDVQDGSPRAEAGQHSPPWHKWW